MAYLTISRVSGDPDELHEGYRQSAELMAEVGRDNRMLLHAAAKTDDGLLIVNLWPSQADSESAAQDPRRRRVLRRHGLSPERIRREHYGVESYVIGPAQSGYSSLRQARGSSSSRPFGVRSRRKLK
jgi:hypothetical protein